VKRGGLLRVSAALGCVMSATVALGKPIDVRMLNENSVLARLPARMPSASEKVLTPQAAAQLATQWIATGRATNDPRAFGYAQQALAPWWTKADAPTEVMKVRARLHQLDHRFAQATADYQRLLRAQPDDAQARIELATLQNAQGQFDAARASCEHLTPAVSLLVRTVCHSQINVMTAPPTVALQALQTALSADRDGANPAVRAWAWSLLAQAHERVGDLAAAQRAFVRALTIDGNDGYARVLYADHLIARGRATDALALFTQPTNELSDAALLRVVHAAAQSKQPNAQTLVAQARDRLRAAAQRGEAPHARDEAYFALYVENKPRTALTAAQRNWSAQREMTDVLLLAHAAQAAGDDNAWYELQTWMRNTGFTHAALTRAKATA
jgi:tetratricopeptide (TPR) repeat protein